MTGDPVTALRAGGAALVRVGPHAGAHRVALRAGLSVGVPLLLLTVTGRVDLTVYAAFGAFASLYGRGAAHAARAGMQVAAGTALTAAVGLGALVALLPGSAWWAVAVGSVVAAGGALLADAGSWHPPGPLFLVFAFTVSASVPSSATTPLVAVGVAAACAAFAVAVGAARPGRWWPRPQVPGLAVHATLARPGYRLHLLRYLLAPAIAGGVSTGLGWGHAYWAMVAAVVPMAAPDLTGRLVRAAQRLAGTALGLAVALALLALHPTGVAVVVLVVALQVAAELLVGRNYALALVAITPLALLVGQLARPLPTSTLVGDRALDTLLGVAVAVALTLLTHDRVLARRDRPTPGLA